MDDLVELKQENFEHREWVALTWARHFMLFEGNFPDPELTETFTRLFTRRQQTDIMAALKMMSFFNMLSNTIFPETPATVDEPVVETDGAGQP